MKGRGGVAVHRHKHWPSVSLLLFVVTAEYHLIPLLQEVVTGFQQSKSRLGLSYQQTRSLGICQRMECTSRKPEGSMMVGFRSSLAKLPAWLASTGMKGSTEPEPIWFVGSSTYFVLVVL